MEDTDSNVDLFDSSVDLFDNEYDDTCINQASIPSHSSPNSKDEPDIILIDDDDEELLNSAIFENVSSEHSSQTKLESDKTYHPESFTPGSISNHNFSTSTEVTETNLSSSKTKESFDFVCPFCGLREHDIANLESHINSTHPENSGSSRPLDQNSQYVFPSTSRAVTDGDLSEPKGESSSQSPDLTSRLVVPEDIEEDFRCPFCDVILKDAVSLYEHVDKSHKENIATSAGGSHSCPLCPLKTETDEEMKEHVALHEHDSTYFGVSPVDASSREVAMACPMCGLLMTDPDLLTSHVESHFNSSYNTGKPTSSSSLPFNGVKNRPRKALGNLQAQQSGASGSSSSSSENSPFASESSFYQANGNYKKQHERGLERAFTRGEISVGEYHEQLSKLSRVEAKNVDDGQTRVSGLIEMIDRFFQGQARADQQVYLCSPTDHFSSSYGDKGWGCGYRNFQMMLSCLLRNPNFSQRISPNGQTSIPSIPRVQEMIEEAWRLGFDRQGCQQLGGKLVKTRKWIGATEIVATLSSLGVKCLLADFPIPSAPDGTHPRLLQWASDYFCSNTRAFKPPLYLQHQGHSRTIVGVEKEKGVTRLLLFDPGNPNMADVTSSPMTWKKMRTFRRTQSGFQAPQYQVVAVVGLLSEREYQESKILKSERVS